MSPRHASKGATSTHSTAKARPGKTRQEAFTAVDLFAGCGGLTKGLIDAGFQVFAAVEIDPKAQATYRLNHPKVKLFGCDIRGLDPREVLLDTGIRKGELDLLAGCPPCQGFSRLRTKNGRKSVKDARNTLVRDFVRFVEGTEPRTLMLENVPALAKDREFEDLLTVLDRLRYSVTVHVLDAASYGVPQRRKRLIVLASREHIPSIARPEEQSLTVRKALAALTADVEKVDRLHSLPSKHSKRVMEMISRIPPDGGSRKSLHPRYRLSCHSKSNGFGDVYGRMAWDSVAPTITSGCHNPSKGRFLHPVLNRAITLREAALLQGFPLDYKFDVSHGKEAIAQMIGNALPPPFVRAHAKALLKELRRIRRVQRPKTKKRTSE